MLSDRHVGATDQEKEDHEKKFKEIAEAYSILSDPRKRSRYDTGQDFDQQNYSSSGSSFSHQMDAAQMFKAFFGHGAGMHHAFHHHFGFGNHHSSPGSGAFFGFT